MSSVVQVVLLAIVLRTALVHSASGERRRGRGHRSRRSTLAPGKAVAVAVLGALTAMPAAMWLEPDRAERLHGWWPLTLTALGILAAYGLVGLVAPDRLRRRHLVMAVRTVLLLGAVFAADLIALSEGVPVNYRARSELVLALVVTVAFLCCCRVVDAGYYPVLMLAEACAYTLVVGSVIWWNVAHGLPLTPPPHGPGRHQLAALLLAAIAAVAVTGLVVGGWRLRRWLSAGPPAGVAPPLVEHWPPLPGEVWLAVVEHDDERRTHKERPVLVWERTGTHVLVLSFTTTDRSAMTDTFLRVRQDDFDGILTKDSWLSRETTVVPYAEFLVYRGGCPMPFWDRLVRRGVLRDAAGRVPLGLTPSYRRRAAMNRYVGPDSRDVAPAAPAPGRSRSRGTTARSR
jgi:hypothetical protein